MIYQVIIENHDEDFEIIEEFENLEDAKKFAENYGREHYRAIWIEELDREYNFIREVEVD